MAHNKYLRSLGALGAAGVLTFTLAACGSDSSSDGDVNYVLVNGAEPQNPLIPADTNENGGGRVVTMLYGTLVYYDADGEVHNEHAESIELEGEKTYRVTLKDGLKFSDGSPITAQNYVDTWNNAVAEDLMSAYFFEPILGYEEGAESLEGLKVVDDHTFTIELAQPESDFPLRLGYSAYAVLPDSAFDDLESFGENPVSSGPYVLDEWNHNESITLVPNENYEGDREAQNDGLRFVLYSNIDAAYADLLAGNLDVLDAIPDSSFTTYEDELGDRAVNKPSALFQSFTIPETLEHFSGEEGQLRRQAISLAIDREEITSNIFDGTRTPAHDFSSPTVEGYRDDLAGNEVLEFDPERAQELWAEADDISEFTGTFSIAYNSDGGHQAWVDAVANQLRNNLGIDAEGAPYPDFKSLRDEVTQRTIGSAFRTGWMADYPSVGNFLAPLYATGASSNDGDYSNAEFDDLLRQAAGADSVEKGLEIYGQAQEILLQDLPAIPLWYSNTTAGSSEHVDNVAYSWNDAPIYYQITKN
ncbi:MAG: ABC transporter substrate-binding protein [Corynebacterium sp.]|nr:ABC transporter substrate-binding protein [Corynebacterium sp.]